MNSDTRLPRFRRVPRGSIVPEIALTLALLAATIVLVLSISNRFRQAARTDRFVAEVRALSTALETARQATGKWPGAALEGEVPEGITPHLPSGRWPELTPLGGRYVWTPPSGRDPGTLGVTDFAVDGSLEITRADLRLLDATLDDGNLGTGRFRTGFNGWPVWLIGP